MTKDFFRPSFFCLAVLMVGITFSSPRPLAPPSPPCAFPASVFSSFPVLQTTSRPFSPLLIANLFLHHFPGPGYSKKFLLVEYYPFPPSKMIPMIHFPPGNRPSSLPYVPVDPPGRGLRGLWVFWFGEARGPLLFFAIPKRSPLFSFSRTSFPPPVHPFPMNFQ